MKEEILKDFDEEFDWRELQYDGINYVPTKKVKEFIDQVITKAYEAGFVDGADSTIIQSKNPN